MLLYGCVVLGIGMKTIYLLSAILFFITPVAAMSNIFDIFNEMAYNGSLDIVTEYQVPDKTSQSHQHIRGWIDIVGFKETIRINGVEYCNQSEPIIKYDVWDEGITSKNYITNNNVDFIKITDERIIHVKNITTAEIDIHLKWHHSTLKHTADGKKYISKKYYHEYMTISASAEAPQQYQSNTDAKATITIYNNTINPHIDIYVPVYNTTTKTTYTYGDETITRRTLSGIAAVGGVNFSECLYWDDDSEIIAYRNDVAVLTNMNESEFDVSKLLITMHNPYGSQQIDDLNLSTVDFNPNKPFKNPIVAVTLLLLFLFGWGIKKSFDVCGDLI